MPLGGSFFSFYFLISHRLVAVLFHSLTWFKKGFDLYQKTSRRIHQISSLFFRFQHYLLKTFSKIWQKSLSVVDFGNCVSSRSAPRLQIPQSRRKRQSDGWFYWQVGGILVMAEVNSLLSTSCCLDMIGPSGLTLSSPQAGVWEMFHSTVLHIWSSLNKTRKKQTISIKYDSCQCFSHMVL